MKPITHVGGRRDGESSGLSDPNAVLAGQHRRYSGVVARALWARIVRDHGLPKGAAWRRRDGVAYRGWITGVRLVFGAKSKLGSGSFGNRE